MPNTVDILPGAINESEMLRQLFEHRINFSPFELLHVELPNNSCQSPIEFDAIIELKWETATFSFVIENKYRSDSLQLVRLAIDQVLRHAEQTGKYPMIYLPYLSKASVKMLTETNVSGFDLCGNLFMVIPGSVFIERLGSPNRFPSSSPIKNIYKNDCSLIPRLFMLQPCFDSITAINRELKRRGGTLTQATVSKVCQQLEKDVILEKRKSKSSKKNTILIQPEILLERLSENYVPTRERRHLTAKLRNSKTDMLEQMAQWGRSTGEKIVQTGASSSTSYAVMAREETIFLYCSNVTRLLSDFEPTLEETKRFADVELIETSDQLVYFDSRDNLCASPIQAYLELMHGDKRDRQTAETIGKTLLDNIQTIFQNEARR